MVGLTNFESNFNVESIEPVISASTIVPHGLRRTDVSNDPFLRYPVVINSFSWANVAVDVCVMNPFKQWINNAMIQQRITGSCYFRCKGLRLRFEIAPSAYYYGLMRASFRYGQSTLAGLPLENPVGYTVNNGKSRATQQLGVDIDASMPGSKELLIPWVFPTEVIDLTVTGGFVGIGCLWMTPIVDLACTNGISADPIDIVIRAWVEEPELYGATRVLSVLQSGKGKHLTTSSELNNGPVSSVATAFSKAGAALEKVPLIGGVASMVSKGAGMVASLASLFGFSRPRFLFEPSLQVRGLAPYALTDSKATAFPVSFTEKQSITLDSTDLGVTNQDEMALATLFTRKSLADMFSMTTAQARGTLLRRIYVFPTVAFTGPTLNYFDPTSLCFATLPFKHWRGSIVYTFKVVCSNFHTGKIRIVYEPSGGIVSATWPLGASENCLLDIVPGATAEITVNWSSKNYWLPIDTAPVVATTFGGSAYNNGSLYVYVENVLLNAGNISILVYMHAGPDFEVFDVKYPPLAYGSLITPVALAAGSVEEDAFFEQGAESVSTLQSAIVDNRNISSVCSFGGIPNEVSTLSTRTFGEKITSLRALLKRYSCLGYLIATADTSAALANKAMSFCFPLHPPDNAHLPNTGNVMKYDINYSKGLFRYFRLAYLGTTGGARYRFLEGSKLFDTNSVQCYHGDVQATSTYTLSNFTTPAATLANDAMIIANAGCAIFQGFTTNESDVEIPDYNTFRFRYAGASNPVLASSISTNFVRVQWTKPCKDATNQPLYVSHAVADDFSFLVYLGAPNIAAIT